MSIDLDTFSGSITVRGTSNQIVLGTTNTTTLTAAAPSASRVYNFIDAGASCDVLLTAGTQTITGTKTWSGDLLTTANVGIALPTGGSGTTGVITAGGTRFIHNYRPGASPLYNLCMGLGAGNFSLSGSGNCFIGSSSNANGPPGGVATDAQLNTIVGAGAGADITTGDNNVIIGHNAGNSVTSGSTNTLVGNGAGGSLTSATDNIFIGDSAGSGTTTGSDNIAIGNLVSTANAAVTGCIAIGTDSISMVSNRTIIGTSGTQTTCDIFGISGATSSGGVAVLVNASGRLGTTTSSVRFKQNIADLPDSLAAKLLSVPLKQFTYISDASNEIQYGAIAETVQPLWPEVIAYDEDGVTPNTIQYQKWIPVLVKIDQLQQATISAMQEQIAQMQAAITALQNK